MSHIRVKTNYGVMGIYGGIEKKTLYCHHNLSCDCTTFYNEDGSIPSMVFEMEISGNNLWDAMNRLMFCFKGDGTKNELIDGVEFYFKAPWE